MSSSTPARPPTENQLSSNPGVHVQVTTHNEEGKAVVKSTTPVKWVRFCALKVSEAADLETGHGRTVAHSCTYPHQAIPPMLWQLTPNVSDDDDKLVMSVLYTTQFPPDLNGEADIKLHESRVAKGPEATGLALKGGTVLRYVEFSPGYTCMMHRTQSVDYGIVMEGSVVAILDSGEEHPMNKGDIMVQRATMHAWKNPSDTEWARMLFCLQDCKPLFVGDERLKEAGVGDSEIPPSGNDD